MTPEDTRQLLLDRARRTTEAGLVRSILDPNSGWELHGGLTEAGRAMVVEVARIALAERRQEIAS